MQPLPGWLAEDIPKSGVRPFFAVGLKPPGGIILALINGFKQILGSASHTELFSCSVQRRRSVYVLKPNPLFCGPNLKPVTNIPGAVVAPWHLRSIAPLDDLLQRTNYTFRRQREISLDGNPSRLKSSITFGRRKLRPLRNWSYMKSMH